MNVPTEIILRIVDYLDCVSLLRFAQSSKIIRNIICKNVTKSLDFSSSSKEFRRSLRPLNSIFDVSNLNLSGTKINHHDVLNIFCNFRRLRSLIAIRCVNVSAEFYYCIVRKIEKKKILSFCPPIQIVYDIQKDHTQGRRFRHSLLLSDKIVSSGQFECNRCSGFYCADEIKKHSDSLIICEYCVSSLTCSVCKKFANNVDQIQGCMECYCCGVSCCYECIEETSIFRECLKCKCWFCDKCDPAINRRCIWNCNGKLYKFCSIDP